MFTSEQILCFVTVCQAWFPDMRPLTVLSNDWSIPTPVDGDFVEIGSESFDHTLFHWYNGTYQVMLVEAFAGTWTRANGDPSDPPEVEYIEVTAPLDSFHAAIEAFIVAEVTRQVKYYFINLQMEEHT